MKRKQSWEKVARWWITRREIRELSKKYSNDTSSSSNNTKGQGDLKLSASSKRAQFQASRGTAESVDQKGRRVSSAPLRAFSFDESNSKPIKGIKKLRRKKILREFQECDEDSAGEINDKNNKKGGKTSNRPSSASSNNGEVTTLVSLLSSEGSDSEKEEKEKEKEVKEPVNVNKNEPTVVHKQRPPLLKKVGKSVSFQDKDLLEETSNINNNINNNNNNNNAIKELPPLFRRNSITPLSTRSRQTRPPTAPLNSLFFKDLQQQQQSTLGELFNTKKSVGEKQAEATVTVKDTGKESKDMDNNKKIDTGEKLEKLNNASGNNKKSQDDENYPDNVQSVRERECYRLYQKMSNMGLNVSFDTVMRGMLTPTELRVIQKKRDLQMARQATIDQAEEEARQIAEMGKKRHN